MPLLRPLILAPLLLCAGCTFFIGRQAASPPASEPTPGSAPSHDQVCSQLRADIASSQYNQRNSQPSTAAPIIAAAGTGKEDQRIEALQQRYDDLGCAPLRPATESPAGR